MKIGDLYKTIFASVLDGIMVVDRNCVVVDVNDAYLKLLGYKSKDEIVGTNQNENLLRNIGREAYFIKVMQTGKPMIDVNTRTQANGSPSNRFVSIFPLLEDGEIVGGVAIFKDLKTLSRHMEEYRKSMERIGNSIRTAHFSKFTFQDIIGEGRAVQAAKAAALRAASSELNILLLGENGTGKELFAHAIHNASSRSNQPFVAINCPGLSDSLAESELFGYEEGSFSGAVKGGKIGLCEIADKGTLFLDEIGDLSLGIQSKLLRLLEYGEFMRVGGTQPIRVELRIVAATNRDLVEMMSANAFRQDLYYRLCGITLAIPSLREHLEDIPMLIDHFRDAYGQGGNVLDPRTLDALVNYPWPGNVRELRNIIRSLMYLAEDGTIPLSALPERIRAGSAPNRKPPAVDEAASQGRLAWEMRQIERGLLKYGASVEGKKRIAREMGISISTLYNKIRLYNLSGKNPS